MYVTVYVYKCMFLNVYEYDCVYECMHMCDYECVCVMHVCVFLKVTSALRMVPVLRFSLCLLLWHGVFVHLSPTALRRPEKQPHSHGCQHKWQHQGALQTPWICVPCVPNFLFLHNSVGLRAVTTWKKKEKG